MASLFSTGGKVQINQLKKIDGNVWHLEQQVKAVGESESYIHIKFWNLRQTRQQRITTSRGKRQQCERAEEDEIQGPKKHQGQEWNMRVDPDRQLHFPSEITCISLCLDIIVWSTKAKSVQTASIQWRLDAGALWGHQPLEGWRSEQKKANNPNNGHEVNIHKL